MTILAFGKGSVRRDKLNISESRNHTHSRNHMVTNQTSHFFGIQCLTNLLQQCAGVQLGGCGQKHHFPPEAG